MPGGLSRIASAGIGFLGLLHASTHAAAAEARVVVRTGDHQGFSRIVLEAAGGPAPAYRIEQRGERVMLLLAAPTIFDLRGGGRPPRNAAAIAVTEGGLSITLRSPDARLRPRVMGNRVVLDILTPSRRPVGPGAPGREPLPTGTPASTDPQPDLADRPAIRPAPTPVQPATPPAMTSAQPATSAAMTSAQPATSPATTPAQAGTQPPPPGAQPGPPRSPESPGPAAHAAPARWPQLDRGPSRTAATVPPADAVPVRLVLGAPGQPREMLLPFGEDTGIALLRRGESILIVLDTPRPLNLDALRGDPVFGGVESRGVPGGTVMTLRLAAPATLSVRRRDGAWSLTASAVAQSTPLARLEVLTDAPGPRLVLRTPFSGRVLAVADPETGLPLLVGTMRGPGPVLAQLRRLPEGDVLPTGIGVAALARSDRLTLRATTEGFELSGGLPVDAAVALPEPPQAMTRLFDIPNLPVPVLSERLRAEHAAVRGAPPLARAALRRAVAETLLALGMPQEAQAMLGLAMAEDPRAGEDPATTALAGVTALLAGRLGETDGLVHPGLPERDETILWQALRDAARGETAAAAPRLAATLPLALAYPPALRTRLLGPIAETLAEAGHAEGLRRLVAGAGDDPAQGFARAALAEAERQSAEAIGLYAAVAAGRDRAVRARAIRRGIELRLATDAMTAAAAADALDAALFAWRGDLREVAARRRVAALRLQAGDPKAAMALLRETADLFPEEAAALHPAIEDAFLAALGQETPLAAVALHDAEPGLLPADARGDAVLVGLAERLAALDLPERAIGLLQPVMQRAQPQSQRRAELGLRLAQLLLEDGQAEAALAALGASTATTLPAELLEARALIEARAQARAGRRDAAIAALRALGHAGAEPLSTLLAEQQDWAGAARALAAHLEARLPPGTGRLEEAEARLVLRQAALLGLAGDHAALAALAPQRARLNGGPEADAFAALTADPLRGLADLPRLQRELALFRALPRGAEPLREARLGTR